jgi:type 1 glutamine amidotransferase
MLIGEKEYRTNETLPKLAVSPLGKEYRVSIVHADAKDRNTMPGIDVVGAADVLLVSVRRRVLPHDQLKWVREHVRAGKPVIGIRTANHAFTLRGESSDAGDMWPEWDAEVFGGSYSGHHGAGPTVEIASKQLDHPILKGIDVRELKSYGSLYKVSPLRENTTELLTGTIKGQSPEPVAWTHHASTGSRVFYTSLGYIKDFEQPAFQRLLSNAIQWSLQKGGS